MLHIYLVACPSLQNKCPEPESNQRHRDFQSLALPTELSGQKKELRGQDLNLRPSGYEPDELPDCSTPRQLYNIIYIFQGNMQPFGRIFFLMDGGGFEPPKALLTDLQSAPFGHSGTHPKSR